MADRYGEFRQFVSARSSGLSRVAFLLTGDEEEASALLEEVLARAAGRWSRLAQDGDPEGEVRRALYARYASRWRRRTVQPVVDPAARPDGGLRLVGKPDAEDPRLAALARALAGLTPRQRAVMVLRSYEDFTSGQAARVLGCSTGAARTLEEQALAHLSSAAPELFVPADDVPAGPSAADVGEEARP